MNIFSLSKPASLLAHYGFFTVLCHATAILFMAQTQHCASPLLYFLRFFPMLEHSVMSFVIIFFGVLGAEYIERFVKEQK